MLMSDANGEKGSGPRFVTRRMAAIGKPRPAVQAAVVHVLFNVVGVVFWFAFIGELASLVRTISPSASELDGITRLAAETPRQIANAHTIFNVLNTLVLIGFATPIAILVQYIVPERPVTDFERVKPVYLDDILLETPELALDRVRLELGWLGTHMLQMVRKALPTVVQGTEQDLADLAAMDDEVDTLYRGIVGYLGRLSRGSLLETQSEQAHDYMAIANYIESIGDMIETNLVEAGSQRLGLGLQISDTTQAYLQTLHDEVFWAVERALLALQASDKQMAEQVMAAKLEINRLANRAENYIAQRLSANEPHRFDAFRIESEIVEYLKRVYYFAKRIAKVIAEADTVYKVVSEEGTGYSKLELEPASEEAVSVAE